ncbi:peroxidase-related enzyme [Mucilaginibacter sp.]|jgi:uncharacterized peroxidase-related enzyme|uniref:carboxymuconolactone decarboxylase family protein n=1 Tax=Mucilaginibacter sp. TaxID=1882438 RepID=UPI002BB77E4A|nr:peroxidase-related enzyme [Mucilaginibacter sp.]HTI60401.1 peroxidase-related enzyme [Mucilaginibacter sp.]
MPHIELESHLPGITGLLEYRKDTGQPIRDLTQILMRGESTLTEAERELIATIVSHGNQCRFCVTAHAAAADLLLGEKTTTQAIRDDIESASVNEKMKALLTIAVAVGRNGRLVSPEMVARAKAEGATDAELHDTVLIAALFSLYNRYVDGMATTMPDNDAYFDTLADRIVHHGYQRLPQGYDHLKK